MTPDETVKQAWQASVSNAPLPTLDAVQAGADRFYRLVRRRNRIEYAAAVLVILCFTAYTFLLPSPVARIGAALVVVGTLVMVWQLHRRAAPTAPPAAEAALPLIVHQRAQLVRQHDALAKVGRWYLLPFVPGLALMVLAPAVENGLQGLRHFSPGDLVAIAILALVFLGIWLLNRRAARKLQKAIDELDALTPDAG
jgi:hypothetical protein